MKRLDGRTQGIHDELFIYQYAVEC